MATFTILIPCDLGALYTGLASSVEVTIYDNAHNILAGPTNAPDGAHGFAEEGSTGMYWAPYTADISKLPLRVVYSVAGGPTDIIPLVLGVDAAAVLAGNVNLNLAQAVPTSNTAQTVGDALNAARAQGFGPWAISGNNLTIYAADGTTIVHQFNLSPSSTAPTSRT